jgi:hypothetical protein
MTLTLHLAPWFLHGAIGFVAGVVTTALIGAVILYRGAESALRGANV